MKHTKISIIGAGAVGSTIAYALILKNIAAEICLVDVNEIKRCGEILDLSDALSFGATALIHGETAKNAGKSDIIIIAAGKRQEPGQDRIALLDANKKIIKSILQEIQPINKESIIIMVTNPVDILTLYAQELVNHPRSQLFGSGTFLDTQRLRGLLSQKIHIAEQSIHAYILGEHGDTQFPAWSCARIAGIPLQDFSLTENDLERIARETRDKASEIIKCKGATFYGIATCVAALCRTIIFDQKRVTPVSCYLEQYDLCMSVPVVLGKNGVDSILQLPLNKREKEQLNQSAEAIRKYIAS
ncbi:L-lactate dehydrogenase [Candidatus Dependentiae bacterium]|nr:MAG: L-lactate dehydrogenase [Candidatus Dependentiae bacterium]